jgi:hypothetical protein
MQCNPISRQLAQNKLLEKKAIARHVPISDHPNRHKFHSCTAIEELVFYIVQGQLVQPVGQSLR